MVKQYIFEILSIVQCDHSIEFHMKLLVHVRTFFFQILHYTFLILKEVIPRFNNYTIEPKR
jgi:hypothetical protein